MRDLLPYTKLIAATANLSIAGAILWQSQRLGMGFPRLIKVLVAFFLLRTIDRLAAPDPLLGYHPTLDALTDILLLGVLALLLVESQRLTRAILLGFNEAKYRAAEYRRARQDYSQIVRHRLANPLTIIKGAALTLEAGTDDPELRRRLVRAIVEWAEVAERVSLTPERQGAEEHELDAVPRVEETTGADRQE